MGDQRHKRAYVTGPRRQMTPEWKDAVRARLVELDKTAEWLAKQLDTGKSTVSQMLSKSREASVYVDAVCSILGIPPPLEQVDPLVKALNDELMALPKEERMVKIEAFMILIRQAPKKS